MHRQRLPPPDPRVLQIPTFLPFNVSSTHSVPDASEASSIEEEAEELDEEAILDLDGSDSDLSDSEIVDIPPSFPSSGFLATSPKQDRFDRSLTRSWSKRQVLRAPVSQTIPVSAPISGATPWCLTSPPIV